MGVGDSPAPGNKRPTATRLTSFTSCPLQSEPPPHEPAAAKNPRPKQLVWIGQYADCISLL